MSSSAVVSRAQPSPSRCSAWPGLADGSGPSNHDSQPSSSPCCPVTSFPVGSSGAPLAPLKVPVGALSPRPEFLGSPPPARRPRRLSLELERRSRLPAGRPPSPSLDRHMDASTSTPSPVSPSLHPRSPFSFLSRNRSAGGGPQASHPLTGPSAASSASHAPPRRRPWYVPWTSG
jgi:hypothetical protein